MQLPLPDQRYGLNKAFDGVAEGDCRIVPPMVGGAAEPEGEDPVVALCSVFVLAEVALSRVGAVDSRFSTVIDFELSEGSATSNNTGMEPSGDGGDEDSLAPEATSAMSTSASGEASSVSEGRASSGVAFMVTAKFFRCCRSL